MQIGTTTHFGWIRGIVLCTFILNVVDGILTLYWISNTSVKEGNPLLVVLAHHHPVLFMLVKVGLVLFGSILLYRLRQNALAVVSIFAVFLVYYFLLLYHVNILHKVG